MNIAPKWRWWAYAVAGVLTLVAMRWVDERAGEIEGVPPTPVSTAVAAVRPPVDRPATPSPLLTFDMPRRRGGSLPAGDPFASAASPTEAPEPPTVAPPAFTRPALPVMPFRYVGKWEEDGRTIVYIADAARTYEVRDSGPLTEEFSVESIGDTELVLKTGRQGHRVHLPYRRESGSASAARAASGETDIEEGN